MCICSSAWPLPRAASVRRAMFLTLFLALRDAKLPVSLREYLTLLEAVAKGVAGFRVEDFYYLARATLVKDERFLDRFDRVFATTFNGLAEAGEGATGEEMLLALPKD